MKHYQRKGWASSSRESRYLYTADMMSERCPLMIFHTLSTVLLLPTLWIYWSKTSWGGADDSSSHARIKNEASNRTRWSIWSKLVCVTYCNNWIHLGIQSTHHVKKEIQTIHPFGQSASLFCLMRWEFQQCTYSWISSWEYYKHQTLPTDKDKAWRLY